MDKKYSPPPHLTIETIDALKVLTDSKRIEILDIIRDKNRPMSAKEIAAELEIDPRNLYYHINLLEKHGILVVAETDIVNNIIEKKYHLGAYNFNVSRQVFNSPQATAEFTEAFRSMIADTETSLYRSTDKGLVNLKDEKQHFLMSQVKAHLTPEQFKEIANAINEVLQQFQSYQSEETSGTRLYNLTTLLFPIEAKRDRDESTNNSATEEGE